MDEGLQYISILGKHFDTDSHICLKLIQIGLDVNLATWTENWLKDRKQRVMTNDNALSWEEVSRERCEDESG